MQWYGSLTNRLDENKMYVEKIEVGTGVTEYLYSDCHAYEVTRVIDQKHVFIRRLKATRIDKNGMSEDQTYKYESQENCPEIELVRRKNGWYEKFTFNLKEMEENFQPVFFQDWKQMLGAKMCMFKFTDKQRDKLGEGGTVTKYQKRNVSFGVCEEYFDFSF